MWYNRSCINMLLNPNSQAALTVWNCCNCCYRYCCNYCIRHYPEFSFISAIISIVTAALLLPVTVSYVFGAKFLVSHSLNKHKQPFNGLFCRTAWVSQHQKGKTILDFNEARDGGMAVASAGPYANHLHLVPDTSTTSLSLYRPDALSDAQPTVSKHCRQSHSLKTTASLYYNSSNVIKCLMS